MARATASPQRVGPAEMAWIALAPCAALTVAAIVLLGPPLGRLLGGSGGDELWPRGWWESMGRAEPVKQGRYLIATLAPALLVAAIVAGSRRLALPPRAARVLAIAGQALLLALVTLALIEQHVLLGAGVPLPALFGPAKLVPAAGLLLAAATVLRRPAARAHLAAAACETPRRRLASLVLVIGLIATWMLEVPTTDALSERAVGLNGTWTLNDTMAILGGRTPLVDFHPIYAKLLPYPTAAALAVFGANTLVYTTFMALLAGLTLLAVYAIFRLVTRSSLAALALFVPFVAMTDVEGATDVSALTMPALWPMRFGGAYLLAWLTVRQLAGRRPRSAWALAFVAGLVILNCPEFGVAAALASAAAWACTHPWDLRETSRLAASAAAGLLGAIALVAVGTFIRAGELPSFGLLLEWPRIFGRLGLLSMPLHVVGLHLAIYATFVACIAVSAVRLARREPDRVLTGMLMWAGIFGLLAGSYYVGRADIAKLITMLSPWSFALSMLAVAALAGLARRDWRPTVPRLLVLFGLAASIFTLGDFPWPQEQVSRLRQRGSAPLYMTQAKQFVGSYAQRDEKVVILLPMSYRISYELGLRNVAPYGYMNAIVTRRQMFTLLDTLRGEQVDAVFMPAPGSLLTGEGDARPEHFEALVAAGYQPVAAHDGMVAVRRDE